MSRDDLRSAAEAEVARWEGAIADELTRLFDRQQAVVLARLQGTKARKHTRHWEPAGTRPLEVKGIIDPARWLGEAAGALAPVVRRLFDSIYTRVAKQMDPAAGTDLQDADRVVEALKTRTDRIAEGVATSAKEVESYISAEEDAGTPMGDIVAGVKDLYAARVPVWAKRIATLSAVGSINQAGLWAAGDRGSSAKQWLSSRDDRVRDTHEHADGQVRLLDERFKLGGIPTHPTKSELLFPGDPGPTVPIDEVINCRCTLLFSPPRKQTKTAFGPTGELEGFSAAYFSPGTGEQWVDVKAVRHVRTAGGAQQYGQPIGSVIVANAPALPSGLIGKIDGKHVTDATHDPAVRALVAKYESPVPDPATTRVLALKDRSARVGAYVVWDAGSGKVLAVSVHPSLRGKNVGDQIVALAHGVDPQVQVTRGRSGRVVTPATPLPAPTPPAPNRVAAIQSVSPAPTVNAASSVRSRAQAGDTPGSSGDFQADAARIERLQKAYLGDRADTTSLHSKGGRWSAARSKQHQAVIDHFLNKPGVKRDHKLLVLGGLPGSGKTTALNSPAGQAALGIDLSEYVEVNADEVKAQMVASGMVPDYPGLTPDEAATLYHAESFEIAHSLMRQAGAGGFNFSYDTSLKSAGQAGFATQAASRSKQRYDTTFAFVDVPLAVAKQRARDRYQSGGRYMPLALIDQMRASSRSRSSGPAEQFDYVKRDADRWVVFDNAGAAPVVAGQGGKAVRRTAPSAPVAAQTPAPVPVAAPVAAPAPTALPAGLPPVPAGAIVYAHPQGKHAYVLPDGSMQVYKPDGKRATSSATPQKLAAGYGGWSEVTPGANSSTSPAPTTPAGKAPALVAAPAAPLQVSAGAPAPAGALPVAPMDFNEMDLADVPKYIADPDFIAQQKVDGIRGVLVIEPGKQPWFASKKGDRLVSSTAAKTTTPMLAKLPATPAGAPSYRVEGEILNGKFHVFDMVVVGQEHEPYEVRKAMADAWVAAVAPQLSQVESLPTASTAAEKQALWDKVLASGAEGVMFKRRDSPYNGGARVNHTLKAKVTATADVVVLERNRGGKDNAVFGLRQNGKIVEIGTVSTGGKDKALGQINVGDVVEVEYLWASPTSNQLTQPRILRKRPDKTPIDATETGMLRFVDKAVLALAAKSLFTRLEHMEGRYAVGQ